jgi:hypothetical protein
MGNGASWAQSGFDSMDEQDEQWKGEGGGGNGDGKFVLNYWTPWVEPEKGGPITKLIILLDDVPFAFWQHNMWYLTKKSGDFEICLKRNKIDPDGNCACCDQMETHKNWPSYGGFLTVIDCGQVVFGTEEDDKERLEIKSLEGWDNGKSGKDHRIYQFGKKLMGAKRGGKDKPGLMVKLRRYKERKGGSLVGTVWAVTRTAQKEETAGTEWEYRGRVDVSSKESLKQALMDLPGSPLTSVEDDMLKFVDSDLINYGEHFEPKNNAQLAKIIGAPQPTSKSEPEPEPETPSGETGDLDDDIPF